MNKYVFSLGYGKLLMKKNEVVMVGNRVGQGGGGLHLIQCLLFLWSEVKFVIIHYKDIYNLYIFSQIYLTIIPCSDIYRDASYNSIYTFSPPNLGNGFFYILMSNFTPE